MRGLRKLDEFTRGKQRFIYCSENQNSYDELCSLRFQFVFDTMRIYTEVNTICLTCGLSEARFNNVIDIEYIENASILGAVVTITCKNLLVDGGMETHIVIVA